MSKVDRVSELTWNRRQFLRSGLLVPLALAPLPAVSVPWPAIGLIVTLAWTGYSVAKEIYEWLPDARCNVTGPKLARLRDALNALRDTLTGQESGVLLAVGRYLSFPNEASWIAARDSLVVYSERLDELLSSEVNIFLDLSGFPDVENRIASLRRDLASLRAAVALLTNLPYEPTTTDRTRLKGLIASLSAVAKQLPSIALQIDEARETRSNVTCN